MKKGTKIAIGVGAVVVVLAILGFEKIAWFGKLCSPWMCLVFIAAAIAVLPGLGCHSPADFWPVFAPHTILSRQPCRATFPRLW